MSPEPPTVTQAERVGPAARLLEALSWSARFAVIPCVLVMAAAVVLATRDRPAVWFALAAGASAAAALVLAGTLGGFAAVVRTSAEQADAYARLDRRIAEGFERVALAMEAGHAASPGGPPAADLKAGHLAEIRRAIRGGHWDEAGTLVQAFSDTHPDDPAAPRLAAELTEARQATGREWLAKIEAARAVNEPERVIELREGLKPLIDAEALRTLDRDLAKWFMVMIHRRLRSGTVRPDVAALAARVATSLEETPEGASLRASLPTLRRAAGLCARCGQPYT
ncbi:MAG: hypothetical protein LC745_10430, partial [Planctomycetia bacterium]|nr:hypothetical protein [Planctomycetia bacterium]